MRNRLTAGRWIRIAAATLAVAAVGAGRSDADPPRIASTNLCTDQLVLSLADPAQVVSVSWLAADPQESTMAATAARHHLNYGTAEELLRLEPDVVLGGIYTRPFTLRLLERLGIDVVRIAPAADVAGIARNLRRVGDAIGQSARGEALAAAVLARADAIAAKAPDTAVPGIVIRPGGFTVGNESLAGALLDIAGIDNVAARHGLDRWGSLSIETLVTSRAELLVLIDYRRSARSLANMVFTHAALRGLSRRTRSVEIAAAPWACGLPQSLDTAVALQDAIAAGEPP